MKIFRNLGPGDPPPVDLNRLTQNLRRVQVMETQLNVTIAQLGIDMPGNAEAVAAAGIAFRASINRSAAMIELGSAAVDALRRAGWTLTPPERRHHWIAPPGSGPSTQEAADAENEAERLQAERRQAARNADIPDDWAQ